MSKTVVKVLWVCNYCTLFCLFFVINFACNVQCQIIRKSTELPVKDYLSSPRNTREGRDGRDQLYVLGGNVDTVKSIELLSSHTPASALMFTSLAKPSVQRYTKSSTINPTVENKGRSGERSLLLGAPTTTHTTLLKDKLQKSTVSSRSSELLEDGLNKAKKGFPFSPPSSDTNDVRGPQGAGQEFIPTFSTPFPALYQNNDAAFGYFSKFSLPLPISREGISAIHYGDYDGYAQYPSPVAVSYSDPIYEGSLYPYLNQPPQYYPTSSLNFHHGSGESTYELPIKSQDYDVSNNEHRYPITQEKENSEEQKKSQRNNDERQRSQSELPKQEEKKLPQIPPTIGVIGWKSNKDLDTNWKPNGALMDMANQYIKDDMKHEGPEKLPIPSPPAENNGQNIRGEIEKEPNLKDESPEEVEEEGGSEEEEEEEVEEEESGEDEEEGSGESAEEEEEDETSNTSDREEDNQSKPQPPTPTSYESSEESPNGPEYNQYQAYNVPPPPYQGGYHYDGQTLPPGPPYDPPPYLEAERANHGYIPAPQYNLGSTPFESFNEGVRQTWTPIIPTYHPKSEEELPTRYNSDGGQLFNGGPILQNTYLGEKNFDFQTWNGFGRDKSENVVGINENYSPREELLPRKHVNNYRKPHKPKEESDYESKIDSKDLPLEHRINRESAENTSKDRASSEESSKETSDSNYRPPPPPPDRDEERVRNRVSDHEFPRKVPTRLRYPGGGLWAKPSSDSGIDLGFVPKRVYTQTRKHNTVRHLPREAALAAASTPEEAINAPRLREVVSHKKIQEVYEEEGYEDTGYDHGGYKKHKESEASTQKNHDDDHHVPESEEAAEEDAIDEHVTHLEAIPEGQDDRGDASGQGSTREQVVRSEKPKVKGSWKQQKTITNEKSMAFLDNKGKGGILTQLHPTKTEEVVGKYLDVDGKRVPVYQEINGVPEKILDHGGAVSFQRISPARNTNSEHKVIYPKDSSKSKIYEFITPTKSHDYDSNERQKGIKKYTGEEQSNVNSDIIRLHEAPNLKLYDKLDQKRMKIPQLSSYLSRNNRFSFRQPTPESVLSVNQFSNNRKTDSNLPFLQTTSGTQFSYGTSNANVPPPTLDSIALSGDNSNLEKYFITNGNIISTAGPSAEVYASLDTSGEYDSNESPVKGRQYRDLTAFGGDGYGGDMISQSAFTHPTAALRAIEDQLSLIAGDSEERSPRTRQVSRSRDNSSGRKYKEIVRNTNPSEEAVSEGRSGRRDRVNVKGTENELNIRHPFLPRDSNGDVEIDYIQTQTRVQPNPSPSRRRHHSREEDDLVSLVTEVTEAPTTTSTPKVTTTSTPKTTTTTTEYTPEDPAKALARLKTNPFLASIFPTQDNFEGEVMQESIISTTTPKITTYRARTTTEEVAVQELPGETINRLKTNPFLVSILQNKEKDTSAEESKQRRTASRIRPIVVLPDNADIAAPSSVKRVEQLTLAHYSGPSNTLLYKQVPARAHQRMTNLAMQLNNEGVDPLHIVVRRSIEHQEKQSEVLNVASAGTTTEIPVDVEKYPFYFTPESVSISKFSPMRYATNPKDIPKKTKGGMEFYESRDRTVQCDEPTPPKDIVPKRGEDGEWNRNPQPKKERLGKLGDQIDCLKAKYFGEDPLDNPFFKETEVGLPNFTPKISDDKYGLYADVIQNIKSESEGKMNLLGGLSRKRQVNIADHKVNLQKVSNGQSTKSSSAEENSSGYDRPSEGEESKTNPKVAPLQNKTTGLKYPFNQSTKAQKPAKHENKPITNKTVMSTLSSTDIQNVPSMPIRLHRPQNVDVSFKSKGTANHPKIKMIKGVSTSKNSFDNFSIRIVPMGSVGYLKSHPIHHVKETQVKNLVSQDVTGHISEPIYMLDSVSSDASKITKRNKVPTTVSYITLDTEGRLLRHHIRTFVPIKSQKPYPENDFLSKNNQTSKWWDLPVTDVRRGEPKYRAKRSNENDKYINSKESLELKNLLLQKYAEILAKEKEESKTEPYTTTKGTTTERAHFNNKMSTTGLRNITGLVNRNMPQYSSRYNADLDPMHESPSTEIETETLVRSDDPTNKRFPFRKPKLRFPKLNTNGRTSSDDDIVRYSSSPETTSTRITSTTTSTTELPTSTTTRMYKPRIVYKKDFGKPLEKVVDMFAVLKRPPASPERTTEAPRKTEMMEPEPLVRRFKPKRLQRFEHRRVTKEEVVKRTYSPEEGLRDRADVYDSPYDHPDLRGPGSGARRSRDTPTEEYHEMLVYMVNPTTGVGEWKMVPVPAKVISRMDLTEKVFAEAPNTKNTRRRNRNKTNQRSSQRSRAEEPQREKELRFQPQVEKVSESVEDTATINPKQYRNKGRQSSSNRLYRDKLYLSSSQLRGTPPPGSGGSEVTTSLEDTTPEVTSTPSSIHSKIIMEPHKRKYFYVKV